MLASADQRGVGQQKAPFMIGKSAANLINKSIDSKVFRYS